VMSLLWGIPYLMIRVAVAEISPATLVFFRTLIGAAILLPLAVKRIEMGRILHHWRWILTFAVVEISVPWMTLGYAEQQVSSSLAGLLIAGVPLAGTMLAMLTGGSDRPGRTGLTGLLVGLVGVAAIAGGDFEASGPAPLLLIGVTVTGYAVGPAILARRLQGVPSIGVMAVSLTVNALIFLPISLLSGWPSSPPGQSVLVSVLLLGVLCTAAAFVLFAALIAEIGPVRATVITYINPAVAAILGVALLQETFTLAMTVGFVLVIAGSALATRTPAPAPAIKAPRPSG
jgi:drug/metabolite transporter (DMT)-like permease